jgi:hypothetical protein
VPERGWTIFATPAEFLTETGIEEATYEALRDWGILFVYEWRKAVSRTNGGWRRYYSKKANGTYYWSSAPGTPPVRDTGRLLNSITLSLDPPSSITVHSSHPAATILEYGSFGTIVEGSGQPTTGAVFGVVRGFLHGFDGSKKTRQRKTKSGKPARRNQTPRRILPRPHLRPTLQKMIPLLKSGVSIKVRARLGRITLTGLRRRLAKFSSALGFLQAWGVSAKILGPIRGTSLKLARGIGDYQAIQNGTVMNRLIRRAEGRAMGRFIGNMIPPGTGKIGRRMGRVALGRLSGGLLRL